MLCLFIHSELHCSRLKIAGALEQSLGVYCKAGAEEKRRVEFRIAHLVRRQTQKVDRESMEAGRGFETPRARDDAMRSSR